MFSAFTKKIENTLKFAKKVYHDASKALDVHKSAHNAMAVSAIEMASLSMRVGAQKGVIQVQQHHKNMNIILPSEETPEGRKQLRQFNQFVRTKSYELDQKTDNVFMSLFGLRLADALTPADWFKMYCEEHGYLYDKQSQIQYTKAALLAQDAIQKVPELPYAPEYQFG